jgi:hypothetical protein
MLPETAQGLRCQAAIAFFDRHVETLCAAPEDASPFERL